MYAHRRVRERECRQGFNRASPLRARAPQKLQTRRNVVEKLTYRDRCSAPPRDPFYLDDLSADNFGGSAFAISRRRLNLKLRDRRDCGEGFTTKAEGRDSNEVRCFSDLGGSVTGEGERYIITRNPRAVVADTNQFPAAILERNLDNGRSSVDGILQKFFYD